LIFFKRYLNNSRCPQIQISITFLYNQQNSSENVTLHLIRYGEAISQAVLQDLPPTGELTNQRYVEARILLRDWVTHWTRNERWTQMNVRAGWVNILGLEVVTGRCTRIARLSTDGVSDVIRESTWLDDVVQQVFDLQNLPRRFMPPSGDESDEQQVIRVLLVDNSADFWQGEAEVENNNGDNDNNGPEAMEASNNVAAGSAADARNASTNANPAAVVSVEQNLARLAIVTSASC
jgi:hypothetical protein